MNRVVNLLSVNRDLGLNGVRDLREKMILSGVHRSGSCFSNPECGK